MEPPITSTQNTFVKYAKSLKTKKARAANGAFLVEGSKCVDELIAHYPQGLKTLIVTDLSFEKVKAKARALSKHVVCVKPHVLNAICDCKTPQGIAAVAHIPENKEIKKGFVVMLDDVQDPQNVGTIIRTADAGGCAGVVLSYDCADCYSPKAVRASMGSLFHLPIIQSGLPQFADALINRGYHVACADISGDEHYTFDADKTCLVIGNESRGVSEDMMALATEHIRIPMLGKAQSLNAAVAAGILIYKIRT